MLSSNVASFKNINSPVKSKQNDNWFTKIVTFPEFYEFTHVFITSPWLLTHF